MQKKKQSAGTVQHSRKYGKNPSRPLPVWNGILEPRHHRKIGSALWEFLWLIDRITAEETDGADIVGWCLGKTPILIERIARDLGEDERTARRNVESLDEFGYIVRKRTPRGYIIGVTNSRKFGIWKSIESDRTEMSGHPEVIGQKRRSDRTEMSGSDRTEMSDASALRSKERQSKKTTSKTIPHKPCAVVVEAATIPDWLPLEPWNQFLLHRAQKDRKPLSTVTQSLAFKQLDKLRLAGHDPAAVIEQSILNNWSGLFPLRTEKLTGKELDRENYRAAGLGETRFERNMRRLGLTPAENQDRHNLFDSLEPEVRPIFMQFCKDYPPHRIKERESQTFAAWHSLHLTVEQARQVHSAMLDLKLSPNWITEHGRFVPSADKFLESRQWETAPIPHLDAVQLVYKYFLEKTDQHHAVNELTLTLSSHIAQRYARALEIVKDHDPKLALTLMTDAIDGCLKSRQKGKYTTPLSLETIFGTVEDFQRWLKVAGYA
jgi:hypothetical protein